MPANPQQDFVLKTIKSRNVHFIRFWFTDALGIMKSFALVSSEIEDAMTEGIGFNGYYVNGFQGARELDMLALPDPSTFQVLPWRPADNAVARMFCDIRTSDGEPFEGDSRYVLKRMVDKAARMGYVFNVGPELEFYYFKTMDSPEPLDDGGYFDLTTLDSATDLRRDTVLTLEKMGIPVKHSHHESGPSQNEIDLRFADAFSMADAIMTYKQVVKEMAMKHGVHASFMPQPLMDAPGSAFHVHQSLSDMDGNNAFYDKDDPQGFGLSVIAKQYLAGLLKYAPEFCLVTNQHVNSYKRLVSGMDAPSCIAWGRHNRSTIAGVPSYRPGKEAACRIELRSPDPAANPYLAFAVMLAAGLKGIEEGLELPDPVEDQTLFQLTREELRERGLSRLPENLGEAIDLFAASDLMKETLGEHIHAYLVGEKRAEWRDYQGFVSQWEYDRFLHVL